MNFCKKKWSKNLEKCGREPPPPGIKLEISTFPFISVTDPDPYESVSFRPSGSGKQIISQKSWTIHQKNQPKSQEYYI